MKSFVFAVLGLILISYITHSASIELPETFRKNARKLHNRCQNQTNTAEDVIKSSFSGSLPKDNNFPCYLHCIYDMVGLIDGNNVMHFENLQHVLPEAYHPSVMALADACGTKDGEDKCKIVYNTVLCYVDFDGLFMAELLKLLLE
ncbi:odorant-binding protein 69a [Musca autumnalis]|uniref:odorant-binding protein 69a n=1 Tax=Musca autumnalis TaxID=221902 RepID=UPI003CF8F43D